jgi:iron complex outermembrane recepter protein
LRWQNTRKQGWNTNVGKQNHVQIPAIFASMLQLRLLGFFGVFVIFLAVQHPVQSQETKCHNAIHGVVYDGESNAPFAGVSVSIARLGKGTFTNERGEFALEGLCKDTVTVEYVMVGYKRYTVRYEVKGYIHDHVVLHTDTCTYESVTVFSKKSEELATVTKSSLSGEALDKTRGLSLGDALKEIPGVSTFKTGNSVSKPVIHGLHSNRIVILNAGLRQEGQQWGNEHAPEIDPFVSDKLTVVKGAAGVRYGSDAVGGVVIVEPRVLPKEKSVGAEVNLVGMSNNRLGNTAALLEGKFGTQFPLAWRIQGSYKKAGNTQTPRYYQANTGFQEQNFSYSLGWEKKKYGLEVFYSLFHTELGIFSGSHIGSKTDLENAIQRSEPAVKSDFSYEINRPFQRVEHELFRAKGWWNMAHLGKVSLQFGRQYNDRSEYDVLRNKVENVRKDVPQLHYKLTTHSGDAVFEHAPIGRFTGSLGVSYMRQANIWQGRLLVPNYLSNGYGAFWLEQWQKGRLLLEVGLRYDAKDMEVYFNDKGVIRSEALSFQNLSGCVGGTYHLSETWDFKTNLGSTWRPPSINELYSDGLHHGAAAIEKGNKQLRPEQAWKMVGALEGKTKRWATEISAYYQRIADYIYLKPDKEMVQTVRGAFPSFTYTQTNAQLIGADISAQYSLSKHLDVIGKGAFVLAKDLDNQQYLINIPPLRYSLGARYTFRQGGFCGKHQPYLGFTVLRTESQSLVADSLDYAPAPSAYTLVDMEAGAHFKWGKQSFVVSVQVSNLFDMAYRDYMNRFRYYTDEMGRNVSLRIKVPLVLYSPKSK